MRVSRIAIYDPTDTWLTVSQMLQCLPPGVINSHKISLNPGLDQTKTLWYFVLPADKGLANWREQATAILVRGSYATADDIARAPSLIVIGKHGVGNDKTELDACAKREIKIRIL
ncbi:hypothetical protein BDW66DRAFT_144231 [Aspergillus desertorum]